MNLSISEPPHALLTLLKGQRKEDQQVSALEKLSKDVVEDMLSFLDPDMSYDEWIKIGMALHAGGYDSSLWDAWSARGNKYEAGQCQNKWERFDGFGGVSFGTLIHTARNAGYQFQNKLKPPNHKTSASANNKPPLTIYHWSDLDRLPQRKYLIKDWLEQGGLSVVYGASNSGKTFVALDITCHIALNWNWHDNKTQQGAVVYIAGEGGLGIAERLAAFKLHHNLKDYADIYIIPSTVHLCKDEAALKLFLQQIENIPNIKLVVIDTLARAMGSGDENSSSDMGSFIQTCDIIRHQTKAHVMIIHHSGKDDARGARGHSSLKAAVDTEILVSQSDDVISATVTKQREGRTDISLKFELKEYEVRKDEENNAIYSCALARTEAGQKATPLSGQARKAFRMLSDLIIEEGIDHIPRKGMNPQKVMRIDVFKQYCVKANLCKSDKPDSFDKAFKRARETLETQGYTAEWEDHIWICTNRTN